MNCPPVRCCCSATSSSTRSPCGSSSGAGTVGQSVTLRTGASRSGPPTTLPPPTQPMARSPSAASRRSTSPARSRLACVQHGGAALFLDYGGGAGDTLQALRAGRPADPLADPGSADLTAHVDFAAFADAARDSGATVHGPEPQGLFLARLGLFQRTDRLARGKPPAQAAALIDAARRLAEPDRMGRLFNALAVCHPGLPTPPGFSSEQSAA